MKFELDQNYFNRAGDKVRYVGNDGYFRKANGDIFCVHCNGAYHLGGEYDLDIIDKWEITDDPDRVYVMDDGAELRFDHQWVKWHVYISGIGGAIEHVKKILIKPWGSPEIDWSRLPSSAKAMYRELYAKAMKSKKIEPLNDLDKGFAGLTERKLIDKTNELIAAHNSAIK